MTAIILLVLKASIIHSVFAFGPKATFADATFRFRRPDHLVRALLSMNSLMPLIALALAASFDLHQAVKIALVVISVSQIPPVLPSTMLHSVKLLGMSKKFAIRFRALPTWNKADAG